MKLTKILYNPHPTRQLRATDTSKLVSQAWKDLSEDDRKVWIEMGQKDRERFEREKSTYKGPWKIPDISHPGAPKKPMSAYLAFSNERRAAVAQANPALTGTELSGLLSKLWKECPEEIKQKYRKKEAHERQVFKEKLAAWEAMKDAELVLDFNRTGTHSDKASQPTTSLETNDGESDESMSETEDSFSLNETCSKKAAPKVSSPKPLQLPKFRDNSFQNVVAQFGPSRWSTHTARGSVCNDDVSTNTFVPSNTIPQADPCLEIQRIVEQQTKPTFNQQWNSFPTLSSMHSKTINISSVEKYQNYTLNDLMEDEELFYEDFSPSQVPDH